MSRKRKTVISQDEETKDKKPTSIRMMERSPGLLNFVPLAPSFVSPPCFSILPLSCAGWLWKGMFNQIHCDSLSISCQQQLSFENPLNFWTPQINMLVPNIELASSPIKKLGVKGSILLESPYASPFESPYSSLLCLGQHK